jgi:hypothetical protein
VTEDQDHAVYSAYLGICILNRMCKSAGLNLGAQRAGELLIELDMAFPGLAARSALRVIAPRTGEEGKP